MNLIFFKNMKQMLEMSFLRPNLQTHLEFP